MRGRDVGLKSVYEYLESSNFQIPKFEIPKPLDSFHVTKIPKFEIPSFTSPSIVFDPPQPNLPKFEIPKLTLPKFEIPSVEVSKQSPSFSISNFTFPKFETPKVQVDSPRIDLNSFMLPKTMNFGDTSFSFLHKRSDPTGMIHEEWYVDNRIRSRVRDDRVHSILALLEVVGYAAETAASSLFEKMITSTKSFSSTIVHNASSALEALITGIPTFVTGLITGAYRSPEKSLAVDLTVGVTTGLLVAGPIGGLVAAGIGLAKYILRKIF